MLRPHQRARGTCGAVADLMTSYSHTIRASSARGAFLCKRKELKLHADPKGHELHAEAVVELGF